MDVVCVEASAQGKKLCRGFSLVELLVVVALLGIVMSLAVPALSEMVLRNRFTLAVNAMAGTLSFSRSEAITHNESVVICKGTAETGCQNARKWQQGWLVFLDKNDNRVWDAGEVLLGTHAALPAEFSLDWKAFPSSNFVIFYPNGTASSNGSFVFCDLSKKIPAKALILSKPGRIRNSDKTAEGGELAC